MPFGFGKKHEKAGIDWPQPSFAERVRKFWAWFSENEGRIEAFIEGQRQGAYTPGDVEDFVTFLSSGVGLVSEGIRFNVGGDNEFTFAVSGDDYLHYLLPYIVGQQPEDLKGKWQFFAGMQGTGGRDFTLRMDGASAPAEEVFVSMAFEEGAGKADLRFFVEAVKDRGDEDAYRFFYVFMENIIGEALSYTCVRRVDRAEAREEGMFPLTELEAKLKDFLLKGEAAPDPAQSYFLYRMEGDPEGGAPRTDVFVGRSCYTWILNAYYDGEGGCFDAFAGCGATPVFLHWEVDAGRRDPLEERNALEDALVVAALGEGDPDRAGVLLGAAMGHARAYLDILLYDPAAFWEMAKPVFDALPYPVTMTEFKQRGGSVAVNAAG